MKKKHHTIYVDASKRRVVFQYPQIDDSREVDIVKLIEAQDAQPNESRVGSELLHVSAIVNGVCPRREWLKRNIGYSAPSRVNGAMRIVWALGRSAEHHVREQLLKMMRGNAFGRWACDTCGTVEEVNRQYEFKKCECGGTFDTYHEAVIVSDVDGVTGSIDFCFVHREKIHIVEIKSMNKRDFDLLNKVKGDHMNQAEYYRWLLRRSGHEVGTCEVLVVAKDYCPKSPYKKFTSNLTPLSKPNIVKIGEQIVDEVNSPECPPKHTLCTSSQSAKSKACEACALCHSMP